MAGYGYHAGAMAGFYEVTGWPDRAPNGPWVAYTDTIAPRFVSILLAAALDQRRRTGEGCFIDVAQIETALHFLGPEFLDLQANGNAATRIGNRSTTAAPSQTGRSGVATPVVCTTRRSRRSTATTSPTSRSPGRIGPAMRFRAARSTPRRRSR